MSKHTEMLCHCKQKCSNNNNDDDDDDDSAADDWCFCGISTANIPESKHVKTLSPCTSASSDEASTEASSVIISELDVSYRASWPEPPWSGAW